MEVENIRKSLQKSKFMQAVVMSVEAQQESAANMVHLVPEPVVDEQESSDDSMSVVRKDSKKKRRRPERSRQGSSNRFKSSAISVGEFKDPLTEKLLDTVNNENDQELEQVLKAETTNLERMRNTEIRGGTLLHYACSRNSIAVVDVLIRHGFDVNKKTATDLDLYIESFDYVSKFRSGTTPIYIATVAGLMNIVALLCRSGANSNVQDVEGYTPMHNAAWHNKTDLIRQLLVTGAKVNTQDITGSTPLRKAAYRGHVDSVRHLLNHGADPNIKTKKGRAPIHCAALYGHTEVLALLLDHGARVSIQDNDDVTPLHAAVYNGKRLAVRLLLKSGAEVDMKTKFGNTSLHLACMEKWYVIASLLVQAGANSGVENRFGETPASIMDSGNAGKRVNIFHMTQTPTMSELEKLEAEHKERRESMYITTKLADANGQYQSPSTFDEVTSSNGSTERRERRRRTEEKI